MTSLSPGSPLQNGQYRIEAVLGQSNFCFTYLATQVAHNVRVCIKEFFLTDYCNRPNGTTQVSLGLHSSAEQVDRYKCQFIQEAQMVSHLSHPNIVQILDTFEENNTAYYVMEFIEGPSLEAIISLHERLPEAKAIGYVQQIGQALQYIHTQGVYHLGVKPANIVVHTKESKPVLIDFGMSKHETHDNAAPTPQTDIYALGATLYELVTGTTPPTENAIVEEGMPLLAGLSPTVGRAVYRAMQPNQEDRPESIAEFLNMLASSTALQNAEPQRPNAVAAQRSTPSAAKERPADKRPAAQPKSVQKTAAGTEESGTRPATMANIEKQAKKYKEVSQQYVMNMARNQKPTGGAAWMVVAATVVLIVGIGFLLSQLMA